MKRWKVRLEESEDLIPADLHDIHGGISVETVLLEDNAQTYMVVRRVLLERRLTGGPVEYRALVTARHCHTQRQAAAVFAELAPKEMPGSEEIKRLFDAAEPPWETIDG